MRLADTVNRETQRIYQQLKRDFPTYQRAVILIAYNPLLQNRLANVNQKVAHDVTVIKKVDLLPKDSVFIFASQVIHRGDLGATNLAWIQDGAVVTLPQYVDYNARVEVRVK